MPLSLIWYRTWPDRPRDFSCKTKDGIPVGRIYSRLKTTMVTEEWKWSVNGKHRNHFVLQQGYAATKDEAARMVEDYWFAGLERIDNQLDG